MKFEDISRPAFLLRKARKQCNCLRDAVSDSQSRTIDERSHVPRSDSYSHNSIQMIFTIQRWHICLFYQLHLINATPALLNGWLGTQCSRLDDPAAAPSANSPKLHWTQAERTCLPHRTEKSHPNCFKLGPDLSSHYKRSVGAEGIRRQEIVNIVWYFPPWQEFRHQITFAQELVQHERILEP